MKDLSINLIFHEILTIEIFKILILNCSVTLENWSRSLKLGQQEVGFMSYMYEFFEKFTEKF